MPNDRRPRLDDILGGNAADFNSLWDGTAAAGEFEPLPPGRYTCLVADGRIAASKAKGTPSYKVEFQVLTPAEYAGRKVWCDLWLTPAALPTTKRDLAKLRITRPEQMKQAPPTGLVADVKVALRTGDDGTQFNRVATFEVTGEAPPADAIEPDADELADDEDEASPAPTPLPKWPDAAGPGRRSGRKVDVNRATGDAYPTSPTADADGFDWHAGEPTS